METGFGSTMRFRGRRRQTWARAHTTEVVRLQGVYRRRLTVAALVTLAGFVVAWAAVWLAGTGGDYQ